MNESPEKSSRTVTQPAGRVNPETGGGSSRRHLVLSAGILGLMTLASRVLGMIRDVLCARNFGTGWQWDGFIYAFMLPNFFRRLVGDGALSSAFIPVYSDILARRGQREADRLIHVTATAITAVFAAVILVAELLVHVLLQFHGLPPRLRLAAELLRIFFPYLYFISLYALGTAVLNAHRRFFVPALGPVLLDIFWIAGVVWIAPRAGGPDLAAQLRSLAAVLLIAGIIQGLSQLPQLASMGLRFCWIWDLTHAGMKKVSGLLTPAVLGLAVLQVNLLVDMSFGIFLGAGTNSSLWFGSQLMQFPLGVFAAAMGTALLPTVSRQVAASDLDGMRRVISFSLRGVFLIILPSMAGLMVLGEPVVRLLFERGQFDPASTVRTAGVLACYCAGLFAYSGQKVLVTGFYAVQDTRTPMKIGIAAIVANGVLDVCLMGPLREAGLALATSLSGILQFVLLVHCSNRSVAPFPYREVGEAFAKIGLASLVTGGAAWSASRVLVRVFPGDGLAAMGIQVFGSIGLAAAVYLPACFLFGIRGLREALDRFLRKKTGSPDCAEEKSPCPKPA